MTKKLLITLSILALFASCEAGNSNANTFDEGVVINGIRWATRNVDAPGTFTENPEDAGMHFQWNKRKGWNDRSRFRNWNDTLSEGTEWYAENDPCPDGWRVPTRDELRLLHRSGSEWITKNGINGRLFGTAPYQIFLPAGGWRIYRDGSLHAVNNQSLYWSSSRNDSINAWELLIDEKGTHFSMIGTPNGLLVRCVAYYQEPVIVCTQDLSDSLDGVVINGIRWATRNVDAPGTFAEAPEDAGMHFQWGRKNGWSATDKEVESWAMYRLTGTEWYAENDPCPDGWRVPTLEEIEILHHGFNRWVTHNGVYGRVFGNAPNQIFLPAAGFRFGSDSVPDRVNTNGSYWSSTQIQSDEAFLLSFDYDHWFVFSTRRTVGQSIRCVAIE